MQLVVYDGGFAGFLTAVFDIYVYKWMDVQIAREENCQKNIFDKVHLVLTDETKAKRVWTGLGRRLSEDALDRLYKTFLSERKDIEQVLWAYVQYAFKSEAPIEQDYSHHAVLSIAQTAKMVHREKHRMEAFIRFQLTQDNLYYAVIEPDIDVLPLIKNHFYERYADQQWLIYDARRKYGLYYDLHEVITVSMRFSEGAGSAQNIRSIYNDTEELYQKLWQQYFNSVNIAARRNMKLHIQHMPRRYWKYLTEKK